MPCKALATAGLYLVPGPAQRETNTGPMKILLRNILAAVAGALTGGIVISLVQMLNGRFYPLPEGVSPANREAMAAYLQVAPVGALLGVLASYLVGVAAGAWLAARLSANCHWRQGIIVGVLFFFASIANLLTLPHPVWFWIANLVIVPAAAWTGFYFGEPDERPLD